MQKKILTQEDLDNNPQLVTDGLKIGDEVEIPEGDEQKEIEQSETAEKPLSPSAQIIKSISQLYQADRLVLYNRLDRIMNIDRDKSSNGIDIDPAVFEDAIKTL